MAADGQSRHYELTQSDNLDNKRGKGTSKLERASDHFFKDGLGQEFTDTWYLPPGEQTSRTFIDNLIQIQRDTKIHHATGHLLPYGDSIELWDLTENRSVLKLVNQSETEGKSQVPSFSSEEGLPIFKDHHYELIARYTNTSKKTRKAAAILMLYLGDKEFHEKNSLPY